MYIDNFGACRDLSFNSNPGFLCSFNSHNGYESFILLTAHSTETDTTMSSAKTECEVGSGNTVIYEHQGTKNTTLRGSITIGERG